MPTMLLPSKALQCFLLICGRLDDVAMVDRQTGRNTGTGYVPAGSLNEGNSLDSNRVSTIFSKDKNPMVAPIVPNVTVGKKIGGGNFGEVCIMCTFLLF